jgi:hypothetical protein
MGENGTGRCLEVGYLATPQLLHWVNSYLNYIYNDQAKATFVIATERKDLFPNYISRRIFLS